MAGIITIKFDVIKQGQAKLGMVGGKSPIYVPGPVQPQFSPGRMIYFGIILFSFLLLFLYTRINLVGRGILGR